MNETKTFTIRPALLNKIQAVVYRLNRRATKLGVEPVVLQKSAPYFKKCEEDSFIEVVDVTISTNIPKLNGWEFVATIQHAEVGNLLLTVPGKEGLNLAFYRNCPPKCCHCNLIRNRADTYLVRHLTTGTIQQVGKQCLADFTGSGKTPEDAAAFAEWLSQLVDFVSSCGDNEFNDDLEGGKEKSDAFDLLRFLSWVVCLSNRFGFRTRKQAQEQMITSTGDHATGCMFPPPGRRPNFRPSEEEQEFGLAAKNWAANLVPGNDFEHNLKVVASSDACLFRNSGLAAYLIEAYRRHLGENAKRAALPASTHFGTVGARLRDLKLTYLGNYSFDSQYGVTFIHRFRTENGSDAIWKTGNPVEMEPGRVFECDATVKAHGDYKGRVQTVLTRVSIK